LVRQTPFFLLFLQVHVCLCLIWWRARTDK
jgi:hypothetical protein